MDYIGDRMENSARFPLTTPERRAFSKHVALVAKALHDIEWVDSGDYGEGHESAAIRACLSKSATLEAAVEAAHEAMAALKAEIERAGAEVAAETLSEGMAPNGRRN